MPGEGLFTLYYVQIHEYPWPRLLGCGRSALQRTSGVMIKRHSLLRLTSLQLLSALFFFIESTFKGPEQGYYIRGGVGVLHLRDSDATETGFSAHLTRHVNTAY